MRVALYHNLPPGGALRTVREFVAGRSPDTECDVFTLDFGDLDPWESIDPGFERRDLSALVPQVRQPVTQGRWTLGRDELEKVSLIQNLPHAEKEIARQINAGGYDVAYVHPCWRSQTPSILRHIQIPSVYFMQEVRRATFEKGYAQRPRPRSPKGVPGWLAAGMVERTLRRRDIRAVPHADRILANSRYSAGTILRAYGVSAHVTHLGVDSTMFSPRPTTAPEAQGHVLSVGGLEAFKGHHLVVEALGLIPADRRPALSLVYERCSDAYRRELLDLASTSGVVVREYPRISDEDLVDLYSSAVATMMAARLEPLGLTALESIACGTPVVAVREGGYLETVDDGRNGHLVDRTPAGIAEGLRQILDSDPGSPDEVRNTVLPYWSLEGSVSRQEEQLREAARSR